MDDPVASPQAPAGPPTEEFVCLLSAAHGRLVSYLFSLLGNWHDAEDVLQRASVTMWRRFDSFAPGTNFLAWACTVAFYESREFRRLKLRPRLQFSETLVETLAAERATDLVNAEPRMAALDLCLAELPPEQRSLVESAYAKDDNLRALAARLGRAPQTLYNKLSALRRLLAECIERRLAAEGGRP